jgi:hypothetical protein
MPPSRMTNVQSTKLAEVTTMDHNSEPVWIMFATDVESRDKLLKYATGSQWQVDSNTAASLILVGAAERLASPLVAQVVPGVNGMSMVAREIA